MTDTEEIATPSGVKIKVRAPHGSDYLQAFRLASQDLNIVPIYQALLCVCAVNGEPVSRATTTMRMDALSDRIGFDGVQQVMNWFTMKINPELVEARASNPDASDEEILAIADALRKERTKNSQETQ